MTTTPKLQEKHDNLKEKVVQLKATYTAAKDASENSAGSVSVRAKRVR